VMPVLTLGLVTQLVTDCSVPSGSTWVDTSASYAQPVAFSKAEQPLSAKIAAAKNPISIAFFISFSSEFNYRAAGLGDGVNERCRRDANAQPFVNCAAGNREANRAHKRHLEPFAPGVGHCFHAQTRAGVAGAGSNAKGAKSSTGSPGSARTLQ